MNQTDAFNKYMDGWLTAADKNKYDQDWIKLYGANLVPISTLSTDKTVKDVKFELPLDINIKGALSPDDKRVQALLNRMNQWNSGNKSVFKPIEDDYYLDPRKDGIRARWKEYDKAYYDKNIKPYDMNYHERYLTDKKPMENNPYYTGWQKTWGFQPIEMKNGGALPLDYRAWEKEMYDSYKCGGKTKKKSCGGEMGKKKACGGMKVKK